MPIRTQNNLPAKAVLENENIFVMDEDRAISQNIRPLEILILNLMPLKEDTEVQLLRALSNTPLQINITFLQTATYVSTHTAASHLNQFYLTFDNVKNRRFDGMIITGAPIEHLDFEQVDYWNELTEIMDWTKTNVTSTFHICWGAQAGLYYHFGVRKVWLDEKISGVYLHRVLNRKNPLVRGFDDVFMAPHSRHTASSPEDIRKCDDLVILATSDEVGDLLVMKKDGSQIFVLGHLEYDRLTLDREYKRDLAKGLNPKIPDNYYTDNDTQIRPYLTWRATSNCLYSNWLNYFVYQITPYIL
ncbi:MAG TPA: homoserine O-succinyltransferase [Lachnospiraceae bacterium]|jgi:homoserine O-succinyltransferase|nr:homoserine O-succinyltransferase [Lachnospiraceae bacterium]